MKWSLHAREKLRLFGIKEVEVMTKLNKPYMVCYDNLKQSRIFIIELGSALYSVVEKEGLIVTVYRTDEKKLASRQRSGRWICY